MVSGTNSLRKDAPQRAQEDPAGRWRVCWQSLSQPRRGRGLPRGKVAEPGIGEGGIWREWLSVPRALGDLSW